MRLLDANVFIEAKNRYYGFDLVPAFWTWLEDQAAVGEIASTDMIYDELKDGGDDLADWVNDRRELIFHVPSSSQTVAQAVGRLGTWVQSENYAPHVLADFMDSADPFLVGAALETGSTLVTQETPGRSQPHEGQDPRRLPPPRRELREHLRDDESPRSALQLS